MYFWTRVFGAENEKFSLADLLDPTKVFDYKDKRDPRAYKIVYDKELHKELLKKNKEHYIKRLATA